MKVMISNLDIHEQRILGSSLLTLALSLAGWSAVSAWLALDHMARLGPICGDTAPHCGWCISAAGAAVAAIVTAWLGQQVLARVALAPAARKAG